MSATTLTPTTPAPAGANVTAGEVDAALERDARYLWHPWSPSRVTPETILAASGAGCEIVDAHGRRYLDGKSSGLNATLGYGCTPVIEAALEQLRTLMTYDLGEGASLPSALLAEDIAHLAGPELTRTFFCSSGSEAVEAALRIARFHHAAHDEPQRRLIVTLDRSYHGATLGAAAATGRGGAEPQPSAPPFFVQLPTPRAHAHQDEDADQSALGALKALFDRSGDQIAAVLLEAVSARTAQPLPHRYLAAARALCDEHGALLILDEVTTGFGRVGTMFAFQALGITPDVLTTSKGLGAGYTSIGAVTTTEEIFTRFENAKDRAHFVHGHTHSGHATACATARAVLRFLAEANVLSNVVARSAQLMQGLAGAAATTPAVTSLHGRGLLVGLEFGHPQAAQQVREHMLASSVLVRRTGRTVLFAPPLIIDEALTDRLVRAGTAALKAL